MKTAFDVMERIKLLSNYLDAVKSGKAAVSNWNDEFGEGNPEVSVLEKLINELRLEKEKLEYKLRSTEA
jgi:hypothetical protein